MEDVLAVYTRPRDPDRRLVCLDETSKQLIAETRMPIPMKRGRPARVDYEYERNGTANLFMLFAPLEGWRHVEVTDRHTAIDYAHVLKDLADRHFPHVKTIVLVQDNLNIHSKASLYEAFPASEARRLVERFEWHYNQSISSCTYSPDRNPDELVWKHLRADTVGRMTITDKADFKAKVRASMCQLQNDPEKIRTKNYRSNMPPDSAFTYGLIDTRPSTAVGLTSPNPNSGFYPPNASIGAFPTNRPSLRKSPPGKTTATPITPRQTGNSQPKLPVSNLNTYTLQSS